VPKQNYGDVFIGMNGGFSGYVSNLWYYNHALSTMEIQSIIRPGPNKTLLGSSMSSWMNPNYFSLRWYLSGMQDQYNS
jgi:hypothetical protein